MQLPPEVKEFLQKCDTVALERVLTNKLMPGGLLKENGERCLVGVVWDMQQEDSTMMGHPGGRVTSYMYEQARSAMHAFDHFSFGREKEANATVREAVLTILAERKEQQHGSRDYEDSNCADARSVERATANV